MSRGSKTGFAAGFAVALLAMVCGAWIIAVALLWLACFAFGSCGA